MKNSKNKRYSLKLKLTLTNSLSVFFIFTLIVGLLFVSFNTLLLRQEKNKTIQTAQIVKNYLDHHEMSLTDQYVDPILRPQNRINRPNNPLNPQNKQNIYSKKIVRSLANDDIQVLVYDANRKEIFSSIGSDNSHYLNLPINKTFISKYDNNLICYSILPIKSEFNHKLIGYVKVRNNLSYYQKISKRMLLILIVLLLLGLIIISIIQYMLVSYYLRPIDDINKIIKTISNDPKSNERVVDLNTKDELSDLGNLLNIMLNRMSNYMSQQKQFVSDVSHELRTPVAIIKGHLELLNRWGKDDPKVLNESIKSSLSEIDRMQNLIQEMLDLSRVDQIDINFKDEVTNVREVVTRTFNNFKMLHKDFLFSFDDDLSDNVKAHIYRDHLEQLLIIFLDNAVKYSESRKEIHLSLSSNTQMIQIAVQDFGEGINLADSEKIFNRFYRVDKARSRDKGGNGLGLSIAKKIVEEYGGSISVESSIGYGSIFQISLRKVI